MHIFVKSETKQFFEWDSTQKFQIVIPCKEACNRPNIPNCYEVKLKESELNNVVLVFYC